MNRRLASVGAALLVAVGTAVAGYVLIVELGGALVAGAARAIVLLPRAIVWTTLALRDGMNGWEIAGQAATAAFDTLATPVVTISLIGLELVGAGALFALARLLRGVERQEGRGARATTVEETQQ